MVKWRHRRYEMEYDKTGVEIDVGHTACQWSDNGKFTGDSYVQMDEICSNSLSSVVKARSLSSCACNLRID